MFILSYIVVSIIIVSLVFYLGYKTGAKLNDRVIDMYKNKKEYCKQLEKHIDNQFTIIEEAGKLINEYQKTNNKLFEQLKKKG